MTSAIELRDATKRFGAAAVLRQLSLSVPEGSITAVLGPSGSGKTTLLRVIAGFERLDAGELAISGRVVDDGRRAVRPQQRGVGYVPQEGALFPHLTVLGNIGFGLARAQRSRAGELAGVVGLGELQGRYPHQLSGGQQQRVALARALAIEPKVVLLDEPFGSLDASLRLDLRHDVARILREMGTTTILVTHDQAEALAVADRIALLTDGQMIAHASPRVLYQEPPAISAALSIGEANILAAQASNGQAVCVLGAIPIRGDRSGAGDCRLLLRPEQLVLHRTQQPQTTPAEVRQLRYHGHETLVHVCVAGLDSQRLVARIAGAPQLEIGQSTWIEVIGSALIWS